MTRHRPLSRHAWVILAVLGLAAVGGCASNRPGWDSLNVGARVSIRAVDSLLPPGLTQKNAIVGLVARRDPESVYLQVTSSDTLRIPRATITRLAVSQGKSRQRSAVRLGLLEAAIFAMLPPQRGEYYDSDHFRGIAIGAGLGGLLGALWPPEDWKRLRP